MPVPPLPRAVSYGFVNPLTGQGGLVSLRVENVPLFRLTRTLDGTRWLQGAYGAMFRANKRIVREVQITAVTLLRERIVRPTQRTGQLESAIASPGAVHADATHITIGVADYLDAKAAYWRPAETGAPALLGRSFSGFWTTMPRGYTGRIPWSLGDRQGNSLGGEFFQRPIEGERTGRPIINRIGSEAGDPFRWVIRHPPKGHWYFRDAVERIGASGFMERVYREEFARTVGPHGKPIQLGRAFRVYHGRALLSSDFAAVLGR